jgi:hydroxymethylpyrimidine pyrophosphatase-like HAD family hydrolase
VNQTKIYCFDIDGTLCDNTEGDYKNATPHTDVIEEVNRLYEAGNTIYIDLPQVSCTTF